MTTTKDTFDQIAPGWYSCRHRTRFGEELEKMAGRWREGRLLNIGCAHGPDFLPFRESFKLYGVDISIEMLKFARKYAQKFSFEAAVAVADASYLPFADRTFDWAISVATYHHLKSDDARQMALSELNRVLRPGAQAFITVWNRWQPAFWFGGKEVTVPWRTKDRVLQRYYYLFSYGELEALARKTGFEVLRAFPESSYRLPVRAFSQNICLLVTKS